MVHKGGMLRHADLAHKLNRLLVQKSLNTWCPSPGHNQLHTSATILFTREHTLSQACILFPNQTCKEDQSPQFQSDDSVQVVHVLIHSWTALVNGAIANDLLVFASTENWNAHFTSAASV